MRRRPLWIGLTAAGVALALGAGITTFVLFLQVKAEARPEAIVAAYLDHVQRGEIEAAMRMEGRNPGENDILLSDDAYANVTDRLSGFRIEKVRAVGAEEVTVDVETKAAGTTSSGTFTLERVKGNPAELLGITAWHLQPVTLTRIQVQIGAPGVMQAAVAGVTLPEPDDLPTLSAFPGRYTLTVTSESPWFTIADTDTSVTGFWQHVELSTAAELTAKGDEAAKAATDLWLNGCMAGGPQPPGCSFSLTAGAPEGEVWTNSHWNLVNPPRITIAPWDFACRAPEVDTSSGCWPVSTTTSGVAEFHADFVVPATGDSGTITTESPIEVDIEGAITGFGDAGGSFSSIVWE